MSLNTGSTTGTGASGKSQQDDPSKLSAEQQILSSNTNIEKKSSLVSSNDYLFPARTPPPGFGALNPITDYGFDVRAKAGSAPPPGLFVHDDKYSLSKGRYSTSRILGDAVTGSNGDDFFTSTRGDVATATTAGTTGKEVRRITSNGNGHSNSNENALLDRQYTTIDPIQMIQERQQRTQNPQGSLLHPSDLMGTESLENSRSKSYVNLAAVIGEGLAESMGNSLADKDKQIWKNSQVGSNTPNIPEDSTTANVIDSHNLYRQTRHSLSRNLNLGTGDYPSNESSLYDVEESNIKRAATSSSLQMATNSNYDWRMAGQYSKMEYGMDLAKERTVNVTVEEPPSITGTPDPQQYVLLHNNALQRLSPHPSSAIIQNNNNSLLTEVTERLENSSFGTSDHLLGGRASAPPQFSHINKQGEVGSSTAALRYHASSLQKRAAELRTLQQPETPSLVSTDGITSRSPTPHVPQTLPNSSQQLTMSTQLSTAQKTSNIIINESKEQHKAEEELAPFVWDTTGPSKQSSHSARRSLVIFGASTMSISEIRSTCEAFGSILYFRSEYNVSHGVILLGYHDLRSARHAAKELKAYLQRLVNENDVLKVMYSISLQASSARDESKLVISNLPSHIENNIITDMVQSFGAVHSVHFQAEEIEGYNCITVEYYDIQDASQALLEIEGTMPWGPTVTIEANERSASERKNGQDLVALIGRWRQKNSEMRGRSSYGQSGPAAQSGNIPPVQIHLRRPPSAGDTSSSEISSTNPQPSEYRRGSTQSSPSPPITASQQAGPGSSQPFSYPPGQPAQLVVGPDGQYSYVAVSPHAFTTAPNYQQHTGVVFPSTQQHVIHSGYVASSRGPPYDGQNYWVQPPLHPQMVNSQQNVPPFQVVGPPVIPGQHFHTVPVFNTTAVKTDSSVSSGTNSSGNRYGNENTSKNHDVSRTDSSNTAKSEEVAHLALDIEAVKQGSDTRTSLMVRNIPNKYTQSMLLSEFDNCNHGPGKIDFFYLPIDFRNKCNRGYAFVNFVDYHDIVSFYAAYNGKPWKIFKSDKICEITYARIQGKIGMIQRFQNSALMEKDQEYRPLVFCSHGEKKGCIEEI